MDPSQFDNAYWVIFGTIVAFLLLAFILLYPVFRFINREEEISQSWTPKQIADRQRRRGDGHATGTPELPRDAPPRRPSGEPESS